MKIMGCTRPNIKHNAVRKAHHLGVGTTPSEAAESEGEFENMQTKCR